MANNYGPQLALNAKRFLSRLPDLSHILSPGQVPALEADCGYRSRPLVLTLVSPAPRQTERTTAGARFAVSLCDYSPRWVHAAEQNALTPGFVRLYMAFIAEASTEDHRSHRFFHERFLRLRSELQEAIKRDQRRGRHRRDHQP